MYGMMGIYGPTHLGTVYKVAADGTPSVVYPFSPLLVPGGYPVYMVGGLVRDPSGNLYGVLGRNLKSESFMRATSSRSRPPGAFLPMFINGISGR